MRPWFYRVPTDGFATEPIDCCPICGSKNNHLSFHKYGDPYHTCRDCVALFLSKRPTPEKAEQAYTSIGERVQAPRAKPFDADNVPQMWVDYFARCELLKLSAGKKHLDVGCGVGECILASHHLGWDSQGLDVGESAVTFVRDVSELPVYQTTLNEADFTEGTFDLITMNASLEHVIDPLSTVQDAARILKTGGVLIVLVPTTDFIGYKFFGKTWHMIHSAHLQYFSLKTLTRLFANVGIDMVNHYTVGGGAQGHRLMMNLMRTDIAWTIFSYLTGCRKSNWDTGPFGWFSALEELTDPRLKMRQKVDAFIKRTKLLWDIFGYPVHWLSQKTDRQQSDHCFRAKTLNE